MMCVTKFFLGPLSFSVVTNITLDILELLENVAYVVDPFGGSPISIPYSIRINQNIVPDHLKIMLRK